MAYKKRNKTPPAPPAETSISASATLPEQLSSSKPKPPEPQPPDANGSSSTSVEVEQLPTGENTLTAFLARAEARVKSAVAPEEASETQPSYYTRRKQVKQSEELATAFSALLALGLSFAHLPDPAKPMQEEIDGVAYHVARLTIRHFPITGKLGPDVMDTIGILTIMTGWYVRAAPYLQPPADDDAGGPHKPKPAPSPGGGNGRVQTIPKGYETLGEPNRALAEALAKMEEQALQEGDYGNPN